MITSTVRMDDSKLFQESNLTATQVVHHVIISLTNAAAWRKKD